MADLFDEILKQASHNTKDASKQVQRIDKNVEQQKRVKAEREAVERKLAKEAVKKSAPPPPPKPKFCIPKISASKTSAPSVDKSRVEAFLKKKEVEKRKEMIEKKQQKEKLIKLRLESYGGKANKKLAKQFGTTPIELQQRYGTDRDHEEYLKKLQIREEEEADRLTTMIRGGVMKALERKKVVDKITPSAEERKAKGPHRVASNKQNSLRYFTKEDSPVPASSKNKSKDKDKRGSGPKSDKKKFSPPAAFDFNDLMKKAEAIQKGEPVPKNPPPLEHSKEPLETNSRRRSIDDSVKKTTGRPPGSVETTRNDRNSKPTPSSQLNKYAIGTVKKGSESSANVHNDKGNFAKPSSAVSGPPKNAFQKPPNNSSQKPLTSASNTSVRQPSAPKPAANTAAAKRYLPGDMRYQGGSEPRPGPSGSQQRPSSSFASSSRDRPTSSSDSRNSGRPIADRKRPDQTRRDVDAPVVKKERSAEDVARARAEYMRYKQMRQQQEMRRRDAEEGDDEDYDSDLDSFIDDSEFDELSRKDFEETLRAINPRYNKKRWAFNERMIDDRFMEARYRDVAREEMRSAKIGLLEDLREAQRGASIAL